MSDSFMSQFDDCRAVVGRIKTAMEEPQMTDQTQLLREALESYEHAIANGHREHDALSAFANISVPDLARAALSAPAQPASGEAVAEYVGECPYGDLIRLIDDIPKGTLLYTTPPASQEQAQPAQCDGGTCGLGGYCDKCPKQTQPSTGAYCWAVSGLQSMFHGKFAEADARNEARRCGGTAQAFPLFREAQPSGEVATVAIDNLHNDRRDERTGYIWPPVKIGTKLYTAPQPAARVAMTPEQVRDGMADWIEASMPHKEFWTPDVVALIRSIEIKPELYRGITSNGAA
jgi:hypothetical protein